MANKTAIAWTDRTFNSWMGCFQGFARLPIT